MRVRFGDPASEEAGTDGRNEVVLLSTGAREDDGIGVATTVHQERSVSP